MWHYEIDYDNMACEDCSDQVTIILQVRINSPITAFFSVMVTFRQSSIIV